MLDTPVRLARRAAARRPCRCPPRGGAPRRSGHSEWPPSRRDAAAEVSSPGVAGELSPRPISCAGSCATVCSTSTPATPSPNAQCSRAGSRAIGSPFGCQAPPCDRGDHPRDGVRAGPCLTRDLDPACGTAYSSSSEWDLLAGYDLGRAAGHGHPSFAILSPMPCSILRTVVDVCSYRAVSSPPRTGRAPSSEGRVPSHRSLKVYGGTYVLRCSVFLPCPGWRGPRREGCAVEIVLGQAVSSRTKSRCSGRTSGRRRP